MDKTGIPDILREIYCRSRLADEEIEDPRLRQAFVNVRNAIERDVPAIRDENPATPGAGCRRPAHDTPA